MSKIDKIEFNSAAKEQPIATIKEEPKSLPVPPIDSTILTISDKYYVNGLLPSKKLVLLYRMTRDGPNYVDFHSRCDNKGPTLSLFKTDTGRRCGGYTNESWETPA